MIEFGVNPNGVFLDDVQDFLYERIEEPNRTQEGRRHKSQRRTYTERETGNRIQEDWTQRKRTTWNPSGDIVSCIKITQEEVDRYTKE